MKNASLKAKSYKLKAHFIGIGGIGMSNLAYWFLNDKWTVSGSDLAPSQITRDLQKARVKVKIGHKKANLPRHCDLVIYSQAVGKKNPELKEAVRLGMPAASYPEILGAFSRKYRTLAVAGAHGKSTTSSLLTLALASAGLDPTAVVGTKLKEFGGKGFRAGKSDYLVLEADEYGGAFLHYSPALAIITNIDREHLDTYRDLAGVKQAFLNFIKRVENGGVLVLNRDDKNLYSLRNSIRKTARKNGLRTVWYSLRDRTAQKVRKALYIPGKHNVSNALAVYKAGRLLGIPEKRILGVFKKYRGAWRRMEYRGKLSILNSQFSIPVYDDYAHHPTEIKATLQAFKEKYSKSKIVCVFQPHQAERLKALFKYFQSAFEEADISLLLPVYRVAGRDKPDPRFDSQALVKAIQKKQPKKLIFYLSDPNNLKKAVLTLLRNAPGALIVMMGAGNISDYTKSLINRG